MQINQSVEPTFQQPCNPFVQQLNYQSYQTYQSHEVNPPIETMPSLQIIPSENSLGSLMDLLIGNDTIPSQIQVRASFCVTMVCCNPTCNPAI